MSEPRSGSRPTEQVEELAPEGPPVGFWLVVFGVLLAVLAPLAGFLGGSLASNGGTDVDALSFWLVGGLGLGGVGALLAFNGGLRWWRSTSHR